MIAVHITIMAVLLAGWFCVCVYKTWQYRANDQDSWECYSSMYDCNEFRKDDASVLYLPAHEKFKIKQTHIVLSNGVMIDLMKYMNWLQCLNVPRASYLMGLLDDQWYTFYVKWDNDHTKSMLLNTVMSSLALKPEFLSVHPHNIWCRFKGGPPGKDRLFESSLLNFIVDRVLRAILKNGTTAVDTKIIEALNYKEVLLLKGPK